MEWGFDVALLIFEPEYDKKTIGLYTYVVSKLFFNGNNDDVPTSTSASETYITSTIASSAHSYSSGTSTTIASTNTECLAYDTLPLSQEENGSLGEIAIFSLSDPNPFKLYMMS